jgi:quercetin dioxygenase-like cupin family protein
LTGSFQGIQVFALDDEPPYTLVAGVHARGVFGEGASMNLIELEPGAEMPVHSHPHEQLGIVLRGIQVLIVHGIEHELGQHQAYVLAGDVPHGGRGGPDGCLVLDVFCPAREDYRSVLPAVRDLIGPGNVT